MLHAITQKKGTLYRRYLGHRDTDEKNVHEEDELTAILLGPLALFPKNLSAIFWCELLRRLKAPYVPGEPPCEALMEFWPQRSDGKGGRIEPDLQVTLAWDDGRKFIVLVELKWRAPLSGNNQLHRQWGEYLKPKERGSSWHIFIGRETSEALKACGQEDVWNGRLLPVSWFEILWFLEKMKEINELKDLRPWIQQVTLALERLGIRRFCGFRKIKALECCMQDGTTIFFNRFSGFSHIKQCGFPKTHEAIFFKQQMGLS